MPSALRTVPTIAARMLERCPSIAASASREISLIPRLALASVQLGDLGVQCFKFGAEPSRMLLQRLRRDLAGVKGSLKSRPRIRLRQVLPLSSAPERVDFRQL